MATWIVGGVVVLIVGAIIWKMISDRKSGKGGCACGTDCSQCGGGCHTDTK